MVDYLTTLAYVESNRIGAMGICAEASYTTNAAIHDRRIKAAGMVSAVNIGQMFRNGRENTVKHADALPYIERGSQARTRYAKLLRLAKWAKAGHWGRKKATFRNFPCIYSKARVFLSNRDD